MPSPGGDRSWWLESVAGEHSWAQGGGTCRSPQPPHFLLLSKRRRMGVSHWLPQVRASKQGWDSGDCAGVSSTELFPSALSSPSSIFILSLRVCPLHLSSSSPFSRLPSLNCTGKKQNTPRREHGSVRLHWNVFVLLPLL